MNQVSETALAEREVRDKKYVSRVVYVIGMNIGKDHIDSLVSRRYG